MTNEFARHLRIGAVVINKAARMTGQIVGHNADGFPLINWDDAKTTVHNPNDSWWWNIEFKPRGAPALL